MPRFAIACLTLSLLTGLAGRAHAVDLGLQGAPRLRVLAADPDHPSPLVVASGLPALSADGRTVAAFARTSDFGDGRLLLIDVTSASVSHDLDWPQHSIDEERMSRIDRPAMRRIQRVLRRGGYRTLAGLARTESQGTETGQSSRFVSPTGDVDVAYRIEWAGDHRPKVRLDVAGRTFDRDLEEQAELAHVAVSPARDFVVLEQMFCACHCTTSPVLVRTR